jgi:hypothetical protein
VESWQRWEPSAEICEWNEFNSGCEDSEYYRRAIAARQWAFVSDYVRLRKLKEMGGVYFDTDIELRSSVFQELSKSRLTLGFEKNCVHAGVMASDVNHPLICALLAGYDDEIDVGYIGVEPKSIVSRITDLLIDEYALRSPLGECLLRDGIRILPANMLLVDVGDGQNLCVHHYAASWKESFDSKNFLKDVCRYCDWNNASFSFRLRERIKMLLQYRFPSLYRKIRDGKVR